MNKCDLVMKGGITSGIVYPRAVCELAREFRFVNIGGTSAGAIAAALTAAAEYRRRHGDDEGFAELSRLPDWLAGTENGRSRLLALFQPEDETAPLLDVAMSALESRGSKWLALLRTLLARFNRYAGVVLAGGVFVAVALLVAIVTLTRDAHGLTAVALGVSLLAVIATAIVLAIAAASIESLLFALRVLPANSFGICSGNTRGGSPTPALTDWLDRKISALAGLDRPLTFGDLWNAPGDGASSRSISLEMMTTCLTHGRPYRLPFETSRFYFSRSDMLRLFPERVVDAMIEKSRTTSSKRTARALPDEPLYAFPSAADLPVVVATRMSLSFPVLLSAVPLYAVDFARRGRRVPERVWFSDGGITSNFPVHFFDAPIPRWPTFAINLAERTDRYHDPGQRIYVPRTNLGGISEWWTAITTMPQFLWSIVETMQNWRDNLLLRMPGHRDRIAHVLLEPDEGGLNLTMDPATITDVASRGAEAARVLRGRFGDHPPADAVLTWKNHKWVRFLAFMSAIEPALGSYERAFDDTTQLPTFRQLVNAAVALPSYKVSRAERIAMRNTAVDFQQHIRRNFAAKPFTHPEKRPKPDPQLRAMPKE